jgi:hypothetical protein
MNIREINLIPAFFRPEIVEADIRNVPPTWRRPPGYDYGISISNFYTSLFSGTIANLAKYFNLDTFQIRNWMTDPNPLEYCQQKGILDGDFHIKASNYGTSVLFKEKEDAARFGKKLTEAFAEEFRNLEPELKIKLLIGGQDVNEFTNHTVFFSSRHLSEHFISEFKMPYFFRTLEIVEIIREGSFALQAKVKFYTEVSGQCHLCGKPLEDEFSQKTGIGPVCAKKKLGIKRTKIENVQEVIDRIKQVADEIGIIGPLIIPKTQIQRFIVGKN